MWVFEVIVPGTWLDYEDRNWSWQVEGLLRHLQSQFFEANTALNLFLEVQGTRPRIADREQRQRDYQRQYEIQQDVERERGGMGAFDEWDEVRLEAEIRFKREQWSSGRVPRELEHIVPFLHARAFLYALDAFDKFMGVIAEVDGVPTTVPSLHEEMGLAFPHLRGVRNSAQHLEDRARGLGVGGKPLDLKPVENSMVNASAGGVLMLNCLNGSNYGSTMTDGHYGEVAVSPDSMVKLQKILQSLLSSFKWKGPRQHVPCA